jgi:hypothetical protein
MKKEDKSFCSSIRQSKRAGGEGYLSGRVCLKPCTERERERERAKKFREGSQRRPLKQ